MGSHSTRGGAGQGLRESDGPCGPGGGGGPGPGLDTGGQAGLQGIEPCLRKPGRLVL